jgi:uncharacterized protein involved in exopolysaccharide biosynthesis
MNTLLQPSESDDAEAIAAAYLYEAKGDARSALTRAVTDAINAIEELRSGLEQAEQAVSFGFVRGEFTARPGF